MNLLFCWPPADFAIYDVARGLRAGLDRLGVEDLKVHDYWLNRRFKIIIDGLEAIAPEGTVVDMNSVSELACEGLAQKAALYQTPWALITNGLGMHPDSLVALRRIGVKIALYLTESPYDQRGEQYVCQFADVIFTTERTCISEFQEILDKTTHGVASYLPPGYDPERHRSNGSVDQFESDVLFIGTGWPERQRLFERIGWDGIDLRLGGVWGGIHPVHRLHQYLKYPHAVDNDQTLQLYHKSKIVLNPHRYHPTAESTNPRTYETAACGVFQITDRRPEIVDIFGDSIPIYEPNVPWQLEMLIREYLSDPERRVNMATEAQRRVLPHSVDARARQVLTTLQEVH